MPSCPKPIPRLAEKRQRQAAARTAERLVRVEVLLRDGRVCRCCRKRIGTEGHHVLPRSLGGKWETGNIVYLCNSCHRQITGHLIRVVGEDAATVRFERMEYAKAI